MKTCTKCKEIKNLNEFGNRKTHSNDGKKWQCKICDRDYRRELEASGRTKKYIKSRKEYNSEVSRKYRLNNPLTVLLSAAKRRAKNKGLKFTITKDDIVIPKQCPVLGIQLFQGKGKPGDNSPSLDRINNSLGYIKGNVFIISHRANSIKRNATIEELEKIIEYMRN